MVYGQQVLMLSSAPIWKAVCYGFKLHGKGFASLMF